MRKSKKLFKEGNMKKLLKSAVLATSFGLFMTTGAMAASTLDTSGGLGTDGCYTVAEELLTYMNVNSDPVLLDLKYTPDIDLGVNNTVVITFSGGALVSTPGNVLYFANDKNKDGLGPGNDDEIVAQMVDFTTDADGNYTSITLKFTQNVSSGDDLYLVNEANNADTDPAEEAASTGFKAITYQGSSGLVAQVTAAYDDTSLPLVAPLTSPENITCAKKQLTVSVAEVEDGSNADPAVDTIDVNPPLYRKGFIDDDGDSNNYDSDVRVTIVNNPVDFGATLDGSDTYKLVIKGDFTGVSSITGTREDGTPVSATLDMDGNYVISTSYNDNDTDNDSQLDVLITVDGTTTLNPQTFNADLVLTLNEIPSTPDNTTLFVDRPIITWGINGAQFKVPYLFNNSNTWVRISNDGPVAGEITVDVFDEAGNKQTNVNLGVVNPNSSKVIYASDIVNAAKAAGWTAPTVTRFTAIFTVAAPEGNISAIAVQRVPGGVDRVIPVLDRESTWEQ